MMGFWTRRQALKLGLTHEVRVFGVLPAYANNLAGGVPNILYKHDWLEYVDRFFLNPIYQLARAAMNLPPAYGIKIVGRIRDPEAGYWE